MKNHINKKKYKFTDKRQSIRGIISTVIAMAAIAFFTISIVISYKNQGNAGLIIGLLGVIALFLSILGLYEGMKSFREEEIFYHFAWIGTVTNAVVFICMAMIILIGI